MPTIPGCVSQPLVQRAALLRPLCMVNLLLACSAPACAATVPLSIESHAVRDGSATGHSQAGQLVRSVMIIALGSEGHHVGASELAKVERSLLSAGVEVISPAATSGFAPQGSTGQGAEAGTDISEAEHALISARNANADAILEVGKLQWTTENRYFRQDTTNGLVEVEQHAAVGTDTELLVRVRGAVLAFEARLIGVKQGRVLASFDISQSTSAITPITQQFDHESARPILTTDSVSRKARVTQEVLDTFVRRLSEYAPLSAVPLPGHERSWR